jgi:hypothetical protein
MLRRKYFTYMLCIITLLVIAGLWGGCRESNSTEPDLEGYAPGIICANCHNQDFNPTYDLAAKDLEYKASIHYAGGDDGQNANTCAGCHTNEGFVDRYDHGFANETFNLHAPSGPLASQGYPQSSPPGCFTCHMPHTRGNMTVRDSGKVNIYTLLANQSTKVWNSTSASNLCVKCHQPRMTSTPFTSTPNSWQPDPSKTNLTDTARIYTSRWNNHVSGEMAQTLLGFGGFEYAGYSGYTNSQHSTYMNGNPIGCEQCHMATVAGVNKTGGHTFTVKDTSAYSMSPTYNVNGCNVAGCHTNLAASAADAHWSKRTIIITELNQLGKLMMDTNITKKWSLPQSGKHIPWATFTVTGIDTAWAMVNASTSKPLVIVPAAKAGALWNLQQIYYDKSHGIHNYEYFKALLDNSIAELNK